MAESLVITIERRSDSTKPKVKRFGISRAFSETVDAKEFGEAVTETILAERAKDGTLSSSRITAFEVTES